MLFNSYAFLFGFLPVALLGQQLAARWHRHAVIWWLSAASLAFYAYWRPPYVLLLAASILFNYVFGALISRQIPNVISTRVWLVVAITGDLLLLCFYKYFFGLFSFFARHAGVHYSWTSPILPLGISFFTFTQIAYLVDLQQGSARQQDLGSYTLFATFFPHLIAGPILHHAEIMPQFQEKRDYRLRADDLAVGLSWFTMGLVKKVLLADHFAPAADAAFATPGSLSFVPAWFGSLSYALQLYFDFSGYSDMALGLARMFSIDFPLNFDSPYKAPSIIEFWQRWHMTLTRYITVYLYNPISLAVSRRRVRQGKRISRKSMATPAGFLSMIAVPTMLSLLLAGIWHGAGLQFIVFGALHGIYLTVNHAWRIFRAAKPAGSDAPAGRFARGSQHIARVALTFSAVLLAQVFFRASSVPAACVYLAGMLGLHHGRVASPGDIAASAYQPSPVHLAALLVGFAIVWGLPNTQQLLARFKPALDLRPADLGRAGTRLAWQPSLGWAVALGLTLFFTLVKLQNPSSFLYFQF